MLLEHKKDWRLRTIAVYDAVRGYVGSIEKGAVVVYKKIVNRRILHWGF